MSTVIARVRVAKQIPGRPSPSTEEAIAAKEAAEAARDAAQTAQGGAATAATTATTKAAEALASANAADADRIAAATSASNASTSATSATTQAGIATTKATEAAGSAEAAEESASSASADAIAAEASKDDAADAAGASASSASASAGHATRAETAETAAAIAAAVAEAFVGGKVFATTAAGLADVSEGEYFVTEDGKFWKDVSGSAVEVPALNVALAAAATVLTGYFAGNVDWSDGSGSAFDVVINNVPFLRVLTGGDTTGSVQINALRFLQYGVEALRDLPRDVVMRWVVEGLGDGDQHIVDILKEGGFVKLDFEPSDALVERFAGGLSIPEDMFEDDEGEIARTLQTAVYDGQPYDWNAVVNSLTAIPALIDYISAHISYGESNSENGGVDLDVATEGDIDTHRGLMFSTGYLGTQNVAVSPDTLADFVPGHEVDAVGKGESGGSSFLRKTLADVDAIGLTEMAMVYRTTGQSGQRIAEGGGKIGLGDPDEIPYQNFCVTVERLVYVASLYGKRMVIPHYNWTQGFNEDIAVTESYYRPLQLALIDNLQREIMTRTKQAVVPWQLIDILTSSDFGNYRSGAALGQVNALNYRKAAAPTFCPYWVKPPFGYNEGDGVHDSPTMKALRKEYTARAGRIVREAMAQNPGYRQGGFAEDGTTWIAPDWIWRWCWSAADGGKWVLRYVPFETSPRVRPNSFQIVGNTITFRVIFAENGFSEWTDLRGPSTETFAGLTWSEEGEEITNVAVGTGEYEVLVTVTFDGPPTPGGTLNYAIDDDGPYLDEEDAPILDGSPSAFGDLFDACAEPSEAVPELTLRQGLLPFSVVVT